MFLTTIDYSPHIVGLSSASFALFDLIAILKAIIRFRAGAVVRHRCIALIIWYILVVVVVVVVVLVVTNWGVVVVANWGVVVLIGRLTILIWNTVLFVRFIFCKLSLVNLILILSELFLGVTVVLIMMLLITWITVIFITG